MIVRFTRQQIECFRDFSGDANPLHLDAEYARRTPFGEPVVYGMLLVLYALAKVEKPQSRRIASIRADFRRFVTVGQDLEFVFEEQGAETRAKYCQNGAICAQIRWRWSNCEEERNGIENSSESDLAVVADIGSETIEPVFMSKDKFFPDPRLSGVPQEQVAVLGMMSQLVGMRFPGRQALFGGFTAVFSEDSKATENWSLDRLRGSLDPRTNRFNIQGKGSGLHEFSLYGFKRPESVQDKFLDFRGLPRTMAGRTALVMGATRGLGAALALHFSSSGARTLGVYRSSCFEAVRLEQEVRASGGDLTLIQADMVACDDAERIERSLKMAGETVDILFLNAFPAIREMPVGPTNLGQSLEFFGCAFQLHVRSLLSTMPSLSEGATIVVISSQYVETPKKNYAYYAAVKSAVEAFTRSISLERPEFRWIVIRLPSLLTDQNNPVVPDARIMRTQEATRKILAAIQDLPSKPGFHLLELKT